MPVVEYSRVIPVAYREKIAPDTRPEIRSCMKVFISPPASPEVRAADRGVGHHRLGRALADDLTQDEHGDAVAQPHHERHVVLDQQHRTLLLRPERAHEI